MAPRTQTRVIRIITKDESSKSVERIKKQMGGLNKNIKKTAKSSQAMAAGFSRVKSAFLGFAAALGARQITQAIDSYQLLKDRITSLWGATQDTEETFKKLAQTANETNAPIATIADGFARISISAKGAGYSVDETIAFVKALQQTLRLSGASVQEANSVFLQMGQAFGLSRLQGQELRAVMLGDAEAAKILADVFDTTKGKLREFGEKGLLKTDKIFKGFIKRTKELNERAAMLKVTFGQAAVKIINAFNIELDKLNTKFGLTTKGMKGAQFLIENMETLFKVANTIVISAVFYKVATAIKAMNLALKGGAVATLFGPKGLLIAGVAALGFSASLLIEHFNKVISSQEKLKEMEEDRNVLSAKLIKNLKKMDDLRKLGKPLVEVKKEILLLNVKLDSMNKIVDAQKKLIKMEEGAGGKGSGATKPRVEVGEFTKLNALFKSRNMNMREYTKLLKIHERVAIDKQLAKGNISLLAYNESLAKLNDKFDKMLARYESIKNKDDIFEGIKKGAEDTIKSIGTVADQVAGATTKAFGHLEDALVEFTKKGRVDFREFAMAILDDINRMVIRMSIIKPLASAISGLGAQGSPKPQALPADYTSLPAGQMRAAKGAAFSGGNVIPFASGGVVNRATSFGMSSGRTGLMGEAGPEAILPLSRGPGGKLGVTGSGTIVNIINNSTEVETETSRSQNSDGTEKIDVYIVAKVSEAIGDGQFDRSFKQLYGLDRRGQ